MKRAFILIMFSTIMVGCGSKVDEAYELKKLDLKDKAIELLTKMISDNPKNADAYFALGNIYVEIGKTSEAIQQYENALKLKPNNERFQSHKLLLQLLQQKSYTLDLENSIQSLVKNNQNSKLGYVLLATLYSRGASYDQATAKKYFDILTKLNDLAPFSDWKKIYEDPSTKRIHGNVFTVVADSTEYYDISSKSVGFLNKGKEIRIDRVENDTIFYTDPDAYALKSSFAWRISKFFEVEDHYGTYDKTDEVENPNNLYTTPRCAYINSSNDWEIQRLRNRGIFVEYGSIINVNAIEPGSISPTGKNYRHELITRRASRYHFYWNEVEYKTRSYLKRKLPISEDILLFKNEAFRFYGMKEAVAIEEGLFRDILKAGYIAKNMTTDLVSLRIDMYPSKFEFNKDNFKLYYKYGSYDLIFVDGLLGSISSPLESISSPKARDLAQYAGTYSNVSETGDSCSELVITIVGKEVVVNYRSWYCGGGGEPPQYQALSDVSVKGKTLKGKTPDGNEVVWHFDR